MDNWITTFRDSATVDADKNVLIPGDPERLLEDQRMAEGVEILDKVIEDIKEWI